MKFHFGLLFSLVLVPAFASDNNDRANLRGDATADNHKDHADARELEIDPIDSSRNLALASYFGMNICPTASPGPRPSCCSAYAIGDIKGYAASAAQAASIAFASADAYASSVAVAKATADAIAVAEATSEALAAAQACVDAASSCCSGGDGGNEDPAQCSCWANSAQNLFDGASAWSGALAAVQTAVKALATSLSTSYSYAASASDACAATFTSIDVSTSAGVQCCKARKLATSSGGTGSGGTGSGTTGTSTTTTNTVTGISCPVLPPPNKPKCCFAAAAAIVSTKASAADSICSQYWTSFDSVNSNIAKVQAAIDVCDQHFASMVAFSQSAVSDATSCSNGDSSTCIVRAASAAADYVSALAAAQALVSVSVKAVAKAHTCAYSAAAALTAASASAVSAVSGKAASVAVCCP